MKKAIISLTSGAEMGVLPTSAFHPVTKMPHFPLLFASFEQKMVEFGTILHPKSLTLELAFKEELLQDFDSTITESIS
jgi:hypothetical protein